jgi:hypothetical protein
MAVSILSVCELRYRSLWAKWCCSKRFGLIRLSDELSRKGHRTVDAMLVCVTKIQLSVDSLQATFVRSFIRYFRDPLSGSTRRFKKRPNFLHSALRLLCTPSVRGLQQATTCPVSVWALLVEIHSLNWARAQAVPLISEKVSWRAWRTCVWVWSFAANLVNILQTFQLLNQLYGENCMKGSPGPKNSTDKSVKVQGDGCVFD